MQIFDCGRYSFKLGGGRRPLVMGILNITPDSFSDGGRYSRLDAALSHAETMMAEGVDIIDIGGESSRPGAPALSLQEEMDRVMPVIFALRDCGKAISLDTYKPELMREAIQAGVDMINDIRGFASEQAIAAVAGKEIAVCAMHMQGQPQTMQDQPEYDDVYAEVKAFLQQRLSALQDAGLDKRQICLDPGFGFGKSQIHNEALFRSINRLQQELTLPVLVGVSRKSMLGNIVGRPANQRLAASLAAAMLAAQQGASLIRVHDVAETMDALKILQQLSDSPRA